MLETTALNAHSLIGELHKIHEAKRTAARRLRGRVHGHAQTRARLDLVDTVRVSAAKARQVGHGRSRKLKKWGGSRFRGRGRLAIHSLPATPLAAVAGEELAEAAGPAECWKGRRFAD